MKPLPQTILEIIHSLGLIPHPEGGYYKETYRSSEHISREALPQRFSGDRLFSTAIYYFLPQGEKSMLHRIQSDETWHFYLGGPLTIGGIDEDGSPYTVKMGQDLSAGQPTYFSLVLNKPTRHLSDAALG